MRRVVQLSCAAPLLAGLLVLADAAVGLTSGPPQPAMTTSLAERLPLAVAAGERLPESRDEVTLDGYGLQVARGERLFPKSRDRRPSLPDLELLMRHGELLDSLLEAPILRFGGSAIVQLSALPSPGAEPGAGEAFGRVRTGMFPTSVPELGTGVFVSVGLVAMGAQARRRKPDRARAFMLP